MSKRQDEAIAEDSPEEVRPQIVTEVRRSSSKATKRLIKKVTDETH